MEKYSLHDFVQHLYALFVDRKYKMAATAWQGLTSDPMEN